MTMDEQVLAFADLAPIGVYVVQAGVFTYVNPQFERDSGYRSQDLLGTPSLALVAPEDVGLVREQAIASLQGRLSAPYQYRFRAGSGETRWALERVGPLTFRGERATLGFFMDITDRRRAEESAQAAEGKFRALVESAPDAMLVVDGRGRVILVNSRAEALFGYRRQDVTGQPVEMLVPTRFADSHVQHRAQYNDAPAPRPIHSGLKLFGLRKDGSEFPAEISLSPLQTEDGLLVISAVRDASERARALEGMERVRADLERRVAERTAELELAVKELEAFAYSVSHDLRAPLRVMAGFSQILEKDFAGLLPDEARHLLERIRHNAQKMDTLINDLLAFSRSSRQPLAKRPVDPSVLVEEVIRDLQQEQAGRRVEFAIGEMERCEADPSLLKQVLANLIGNALKFTRSREVARIAIGMESRGNARAYYVKDNGVGFDQEQAGRLFQVFQRLHRPEDYEGTGIGLAIAQRIIHRHGGRIWAEAIPDKGATFFFTLP